ncbi:hypothetical protein [Escherichia albertii]|uniref:hypothetical protein n=1 Tax=Escherichia albertii TaxID=208962 RepID=UPI000BF2D6CC|nr:hypothetical protein [Escherichia albertii]PFF96447.1 hypothetical protein CRH02_09720 [Escherichia albertii]WDC35020.1 hypothetical protein PS048_02625 [Escherichia albertii]
MKRIIAGCITLALSGIALAECNITSTTQNIDYGKRSAAMRQADRGKITQLTDRSATLILQCDKTGRIRLQIAPGNIVNGNFGFGTNGSMNLSVSNAFAGNDSLDLALVNNLGDSVSGVGTSSVLPSPGNWLVLMNHSQEAEIDSSKSVSMTLTISPSFKDEADITDMTDIAGNLNIQVEVL